MQQQEGGSWSAQQLPSQKPLSTQDHNCVFCSCTGRDNNIKKSSCTSTGYKLTMRGLLSAATGLRPGLTAAATGSPVDSCRGQLPVVDKPDSMMTCNWEGCCCCLLLELLGCVGYRHISSKPQSAARSKLQVVVRQHGVPDVSLFGMLAVVPSPHFVGHQQSV